MADGGIRRLSKWPPPLGCAPPCPRFPSYHNLLLTIICRAGWRPHWCFLSQIVLLYMQFIIDLSDATIVTVQDNWMEGSVILHQVFISGWLRRLTPKKSWVRIPSPVLLMWNLHGCSSCSHGFPPGAIAEQKLPGWGIDVPKLPWVCGFVTCSASASHHPGPALDRLSWKLVMDVTDSLGTL